MKDIEQRIDQDYDQFLTLLRQGSYNAAFQDITARLASDPERKRVSYDRFRTATEYIEEYLKVYLWQLSDREFLNEFTKYIDSPNREFPPITAYVLGKKSIVNMKLFESACAYVLRQQRSEVCYLCMRSVFRTLHDNVPDCESFLGSAAGALRRHVAAQNLPPLNGSW